MKWFTPHPRPFRVRFFQGDMQLYATARSACSALEAMEEGVKDYDHYSGGMPDFIVTRIDVTELGVNLPIDPPG